MTQEGFSKRRISRIGALIMGVVLGMSSANSIAADASGGQGPKEPLLMEGKSTLYQRVLTTPTCKLYQNLSNTEDGSTLPAFSQFYVYADLDRHYQVGSNATGKIDGFLSKDCVVPWKQQLAMLFTNSAGRNRSLIYENEETVDELLNLESTADGFSKLYEKVLLGEQAPGVISIEPENYVDYEQHFYLLPILNSVESMFMDGSYTYKHEIASIISKEAESSSSAQASKTQGQAQAQSSSPSASTEPSIVGFKTAIVFVIDSSISMQPYIDRTKQAVNTIYKSIEKENLNDSVQFGIISFRGDSRLRPGLEYTTKMYLKPGDATSATEFNKAVESFEQATVSSAQFSEDSYAGINMALQDIDWQGYGGRYIVLITDAGAIDAYDSQSSTQLDAKALRTEASRVGAAIYTLHLLTKSGQKNHDSAQAQYEELSFNSILNKSLYYPVNASSVKPFGEIVELLSDSLTEQVLQASLGNMSAGSSLAADKAAEIAKDKDLDEQTQANLKQVQEDSAKLGLAMQLAYLGRVEGTESPSFMRGWLTDRDMVDHNKMVCTPIVLVNRNQLSDLYTLVDGVLKSGIAGQLSSDDMFAQLQALAAQMGRDPNQLDKSKSISDMGIMSELLDDLPYKSQIASLTPDDWYNLGSQEQDNIIRSLETSLNYLQYCSSDNDRWIKLNELSDESEQVYPIPLDALP